METAEVPTTGGRDRVREALREVVAIQADYMRDGNAAVACHAITKAFVAATHGFCGGFAEVGPDGHARILVTVGVNSEYPVEFDVGHMRALSQAAVDGARVMEQSFVGRLRPASGSGQTIARTEAVTCRAVPVLDEGRIVAVLTVAGRDMRPHETVSPVVDALLQVAGAVAATSRTMTACVALDPATMHGHPQDPVPAVRDPLAALAASEDGYALAGPDGCIEHANAAFVAAYGPDASTIVGRTFDEVLRIAATSCGTDGHADRPLYHGFELTGPWREADGSGRLAPIVRFASGRVMTVRSAPAGDGTTLLHQQDVSEIARRLHEAASPATDVAASDVTRADFDAEDVIDALPVAMLMVDGTGIVRRANGPAGDVLGREPSSLRGAPVDDLIRRDGGDGGADGDDAAAWIPARAIGPDGSCRPVRMATRAVPGHGDGTLFVTSLVAAAEGREDDRGTTYSGRAGAVFLASASHELRTPLNAIVGFAEVLESRAFGPLTDRQAEYVRDIYSAGRHLIEIIDHVLDFARVESGRIELEEDDVDVDEVIDEALRMIRPLADRGGIALQRPRTGEAPMLRCDRRALRQVLINLLSNAVKFTAPDGIVALHRDVVDGRLALTIEDDGRGMRGEDVPRLLEPFARGSAESGEAQPAGTGLGLAIVRSLVDLHGGQLRIDSAPGQGTAVEVSFPPERLLAPAEPV